MYKVIFCLLISSIFSSSLFAEDKSINTEFTTLSKIGPYDATLVHEIQFFREAAHPNHHIIIKTTKVEDEDKEGVDCPIQSLYSYDQIYDAIFKAAKIPRPETNLNLKQALFLHLDKVTKGKFESVKDYLCYTDDKQYESSYFFDHLKNNQIAVRFVFPFCGGSGWGGVAQVGVYLPVNEKIKDFIKNKGNVWGSKLKKDVLPDVEYFF